MPCCDVLVHVLCPVVVDGGAVSGSLLPNHVLHHYNTLKPPLLADAAASKGYCMVLHFQPTAFGLLHGAVLPCLLMTYAGRSINCR
jgi:hypothetical protein